MTSLHQSAWSVELATSGQAQDWVHLLPLGTFNGRDGRGPYTVRDAANIIAATHKLGMDLPVDYEHQIDHATKNGQPAPAAGWIKELRANAQGIWGRVEWTDKARQHLASKEYRFLSPVFTFYKTTGEIMRLHRAALTNNPTYRFLIRRSKSDPFGAGRIAFCSPRTARLLDDWRDWRGLNTWLFCPIYKDKPVDRSLSDTTVKRMIRAAARRCCDPEVAAAFSGHSMRVGAAQDLLKRGLDTVGIMRAGGWKSVNVLARYLEHADHNPWL